MRRASPSRVLCLRSHVGGIMLVAGLGLGLGCAPEAEPEPEIPALAACEQVADWDAAHAEFEREVLDQINLRRANGGKCGGAGEFPPAAEPLRMNPALRCAARRHTQAMVEADLVAHEIPEGESFRERAAAAEYAGEAVAQSIAAGHRDPTRVVATWMSNDRNCANLLHPDATELGVGYRPGRPPGEADGTAYDHYWTAVFGVGE
jgi:uncharacterized protein YkwD